MEGRENYCGETEISSRDVGLLNVIHTLIEKGYEPARTDKNTLHLVCAGKSRQAHLEYLNHSGEYKIKVKFSRLEAVA
ncbi:hypothetical protein J4402_02135 [Candidatus Pacearchaeota archaeon]|nr:hypothetical protein [uncultured archaeon]AQS31860.1 hypothetical protein [uncultured archaeon]MBS3088557.1 hypothetical protein [Candidatus Pacearchaeota archaeon]